MTDDTPGMDVEELVEETNDRYQEQQEAQEEFLQAVSKEEGAEVLETTVTLVGDYTVDVSAKLSGRLNDRIGHIQERAEAAQENGRVYEISEVADDAAQLLSDLIDNSEYTKAMFYSIYEREGLDVLGQFAETIFNGLEAEKDRRRGTADGFRKE